MAMFTASSHLTLTSILGDIIYPIFYLRKPDQQGWRPNQGHPDVSSRVETDSRSPQWLSVQNQKERGWEITLFVLFCFPSHVASFFLILFFICYNLDHTS